jgi:hypothetical protein
MRWRPGSTSSSWGPTAAAASGARDRQPDGSGQSARRRAPCWRYGRPLTRGRRPETDPRPARFRPRALPALPGAGHRALDGRVLLLLHVIEGDRSDLCYRSAARSSCASRGAPTVGRGARAPVLAAEGPDVPFDVRVGTVARRPRSPGSRRRRPRTPCSCRPTVSPRPTARREPRRTGSAPGSLPGARALRDARAGGESWLADRPRGAPPRSVDRPGHLVEEVP